MNNNFFLASDPLLTPSGAQSPQNEYDMRIAQLEAARNQLIQQKQQVSQPMQQSRTPVWDEIDTLVNGMTDTEVELLNANEEYQSSQQKIMMILQREYMSVMRPMVEGTKDGKEALDSHLDLTKRLKKGVTEETNKGMALFNEYTAKYSHLSWDEFLKLKKEQESPLIGDGKGKGGKK